MNERAGRPRQDKATDIPTTGSLGDRKHRGIRGIGESRIGRKIAAQQHDLRRENVYAHGSTEDILVDPETNQLRFNHDVDPDSVTPERAEARQFLGGLSTQQELRLFKAGIDRAVAEEQFAASNHVLDHAQATDVFVTREGDVIVNPGGLGSHQMDQDRADALEILTSMPYEVRTRFGRVLGDPDAREALREKIWDEFEYHPHHDDDDGF